MVMPGSIGLMICCSIALRASGCVPFPCDGKTMSPGSFIASPRRSTSNAASDNGTSNGSGLPLSAVFTAGTIQTRRLRSMSVQRIGGLASPLLLTPMMSPVRQAVSMTNSSARGNRRIRAQFSVERWRLLVVERWVRPVLFDLLEAAQRQADVLLVRDRIDRARGGAQHGLDFLLQLARGLVPTGVDHLGDKLGDVSRCDVVDQLVAEHRHRVDAQHVFPVRARFELVHVFERGAKGDSALAGLCALVDRVFSRGH